jgi:hypothetical protein
MARKRKARFEKYTPAEKRAVLRRYHEARAKGQAPTAAARRAGTDLVTIENWLDAPVAITPKDRRCLGGCGQEFRSSWPGERICPACRRAFDALPRQWTA